MDKQHYKSMERAPIVSKTFEQCARRLVLHFLCMQLLISYVILSFSISSGLLSVYTSVLPLFTDNTSPLYHGQVTSAIHPSVRILVSDPSGVDTVPQPALGRDCFQVNCDGTYTVTDEDGSSDSVLSDTVIILICVFGALALVLLSFAWFHFYRKRQIARRMKDFEHTAKQHAIVHAPQ